MHPPMRFACALCVLNVDLFSFHYLYKLTLTKNKFETNNHEKLPKNGSFWEGGQDQGMILKDLEYSSMHILGVTATETMQTASVELLEICQMPMTIIFR